MVFVLGISAHHRESAAVLLSDGIPVAALTESSFTKTPMDASLPLRAARACLARAGVMGPDLHAVVFYEKPLRRFERVMVNSLRCFPRGGRAFAREITSWLGDKLWLRGELMEEFGVPQDRIRFVEHLQSHAANAFYISPFDEAAVLVVDDLGEWGASALFHGDESGLRMIEETVLPHSLGLAVSAFAQFLGFPPGLGDVHLQDLACIGTPRMREQVASVIGLSSDGHALIDSDVLNLSGGPGSLFKPAMADLFGAARIPGEPLGLSEGNTRDADLAASLQVVLQEHGIALAKRACEKAGVDRLCFAGTLASNRGVNRAILESGGTSGFFVPPHPCDAGGAMGAALLVHREVADVPNFQLRQAIDLGDVPGFMEQDKAFQKDQDALALVPHLVAGESVAWLRSSLEFASESLRHRIILADAHQANACQRMLACLQRSEPYLFCRLAMPVEELQRFINVPAGSQVALELGQLQVQALPALIKAAPSAIAPDGSVRVQSVDAEQDPGLHALLLEMGESSGDPLLVIDSFYLRDRVVPRFDDAAHEAFSRSQLSAMLIEDRLYESSTGAGKSL